MQIVLKARLWREEQINCDRDKSDKFSISDEIDDIQQEIAMLSECSSPYVTKYYGSYLNSKELWIVMELLTGGSANDLLKSKRHVFFVYFNRYSFQWESSMKSTSPLSSAKSAEHSIIFIQKSAKFTGVPFFHRS